MSTKVVYEKKGGRNLEPLRETLRRRIRENCLTYTWLINMMRLKYGYEVDKTTVSSVINGAITGDRATKIVTLGNEILDIYEHEFLDSILP